MKTGLAAVSALAVAALLAGCSGDPEPAPTALPPLPSASASPSSISPPTSASPVPLPSEAKAATPGAAAAFARYYFAVLNHALVTHDVSQLTQISDPMCTTCNNYKLAIRELESKHQRLEGGLFVLESAESSGLTGDLQIVDVAWKQPPSVIYDSAGRVVQRGRGAGRTFGQVSLKRDQERWLVRGVRIVQGAR